MTIDVLLFASYAEAFGTNSVSLDVPEGSSVGEVMSWLREAAGGASLPPQPVVALNQTYASLHEIVRAGDELAVIPPVAGG